MNAYEIEGREDGAGAEMGGAVWLTGQPARDGLVQEEGESAVYEGAGVVVGVEAAVGGVKVFADARRPADLVGYQRQEALVRVQVLAIVPVDVVEPESEREDDYQEQEGGREAVGPQPERGALAGRLGDADTKSGGLRGGFDRLQSVAPAEKAGEYGLLRVRGARKAFESASGRGGFIG